MSRTCIRAPLCSPAMPQPYAHDKACPLGMAYPDRIAQLEAENSSLQAKVSALQATVAEQSNGLIDLRQLQRDIALERSAHARTQAQAAAIYEAADRVAGITPRLMLEGDLNKLRDVLNHHGNAGRALAERVALWRELQRIGNEVKGTGGTNPDDGPFSRLRGVLAKLAALDEKKEA